MYLQFLSVPPHGFQTGDDLLKSVHFWICLISFIKLKFENFLNVQCKFNKKSEVPVITDENDGENLLLAVSYFRSCLCIKYAVNNIRKKESRLYLQHLHV